MKKNKILIFVFLFFLFLGNVNAYGDPSDSDYSSINNESVDNPKEDLDVNSEVKKENEDVPKNTYEEIVNENTNSTPPTNNINIENPEINTIRSNLIETQTLDLNSINGLSVNKNIITFYFSNPTENKILNLILNSSGGNKTLNLNTILPQGKIAIHIINGKFIQITNNGKKILTKRVDGIGGIYTNLKINFEGSLFLTKFKIYYTGKDLITLKNKKITSNLIKGNFQKDNSKRIISSKTELKKEDVKKVFNWNPSTKKFEITESLNNKKEIKISLPTELKKYIKEKVTPLQLINGLKPLFTSNVTFIKEIEIDGDTNSREFLIKFNDTNEFFLGRIELKKITNGNIITYKINITKLYKGVVNLTNLTSIELDGNTNTKEFYLENGIYTYIYQYKEGNFFKLLGEKYIKVYFGHLLDKNGTSWKVLFSLATQETPESGKYYTIPLFKLYWYDITKNIYYMKQTKDFTDYDTLKLKLDSNYIYYKENGTVDKTKTDYITD